MRLSMKYETDSRRKNEITPLVRNEVRRDDDDDDVDKVDDDDYDDDPICWGFIAGSRVAHLSL